MPRDVMPVDADGAILLRAAAIIEEHGWCQKNAWRLDGKMCMWGAIGIAKPDAWTWDGGKPFASRLGFYSIQQAWRWNDEAGRTKEDVVARLRAAAYAPVPA